MAKFTTNSAIEVLCERVRHAAEVRTPLRIRGGGSKDFYGGESTGELLDARGLSGIVAYEPRELVLTVQAGTPLAEVEAALSAERQMLAFEPPHFGLGATIGGAVATGLSGPRRPYAGAVRDFVLGTNIINGKGEALAFGGRVIKNVAGYDVSRLMTGAMGTLGVLTEVSFKVLPLPVAETTMRLEMAEAQAIESMNRWAGQPLPLSATAWQAGILHVRLSGASSAVSSARAKLGGEEMPDGHKFWMGLREQTAPFFSATSLWRVCVPQTVVPLGMPQPQLIEWGGGVRWLTGDLDAVALREKVAALGGHVILFRGGDKSVGVFHPLAPAIAKIHRRLKDAFDPAGILNPGRMPGF
jgi:glycolate oxidase FAD binding subunit